MITVLDENQESRDMELSEIMQMPYLTIKDLEICNADAITIFKPENTYPLNYQEYELLYKDYPHLYFPSYVKTLMFTSVHRRGKNLKKNLDMANGRCLDFGAGVGTHLIYLMQKRNKVWSLDLPGKLSDFVLQRLKYRNMYHNFRAVDYSSMLLPENFFDFVNCLDVIEHCYDPLQEIQRIYKSLKQDGILHLQVSEMIKPSSGHFKESIDKWRLCDKEFMKSNFYNEDKNIYRKM